MKKKKAQDYPEKNQLRLDKLNLQIRNIELETQLLHYTRRDLIVQRDGLVKEAEGEK